MHWDLRNNEECGQIAHGFIAAWRRNIHRKYSFLWAQYESFKILIWQTQILAFLNTLLNFTGPLMVSQIIGYTEDENATVFDGVRLIFLFILSRIVIISLSAQSTQLNVTIWLCV